MRMLQIVCLGAMAHFFTADTHFHDDSIRRFFGRPFDSVQAMDAAMIERFQVLDCSDDLWVVGDFADCETEAGQAAARLAFEAMPGKKHLVRGNHDPDWVVKSLPWDSTHDLVEIEIEKRKFVLCHYPLVTWNNAREGAVHVFGHVHTNWRGAEGQVNVGVDQWDFRPVNTAEAELAALTLPTSSVHQVAEGMR